MCTGIHIQTTMYLYPSIATIQQTTRTHRGHHQWSGVPILASCQHGKVTEDNNARADGESADNLREHEPSNVELDRYASYR
mmetsp:Transcript_94037/g.162655  ORF Transcript_94037/g.162655 Transcript_94037/m.162655 type:complete len:81 (-) Transcript_94037:1305-1547(-)